MHFALARCATMLVMFAFVFLSASLSAQTASIEGRVTDPQGGAIVDAIVTLNVSAPASQRTARTGADGRFTFTNVQAGPYTLRVEAPNFEPATQNVTLGNSAQSLDVVLQVAGVSETVVVAAPKLEEELPQEIERRASACRRLPARRSRTAATTTCARRCRRWSRACISAPKAGAFDYVAVSLQGSRTNEILWLVDGVRISNRLYNGTTPLDTLPAHMIERIEVIEGGQGLFYGTQAVAGVINVVTKAFTETPSGRFQAGFDTNEGRHFNMFARDSTRRPPVRVLRLERSGRRVSVVPRGRILGQHDRPQPQLRRAARSGASTPTTSRRSCDSAPLSAQRRQLDSLRPARSSATQVGGLAAAFNERDGAHRQHQAGLHAKRDRAVLLQVLPSRLGFVLQREAKLPGEPGNCSAHQRRRVLGLQGLRRERARQVRAYTAASSTSPATTSRTTRVGTTSC